MADEETPSPAPAPEANAAAVAEAPAPRRRRGRTAKAEETKPATPEPPAKPASGDDEGPRVPKRAQLSEPAAKLLHLRRVLDTRRPIFGRQAANRYYRIGRDGAWRRPRGLQSKQRRHYGYRTQIVSIGYRSPARVRGLVPSGFRPVIVRTEGELDGLDAKTQAAVIARTVGTRRRLALEEAARKLGIRVLNPIVKTESEA
ncbi:MAG TPA: 50S ribosomal protein L32e [Thermoplasmata archaeon]|nr:50S ribosomal protein L32e [Thermoplasmata archaeon]